MKQDNKLMNIKDAATALGVTRNTVFNMADRGLLRIVEKPFGRPRHFVPTEDVEKLLKAVEDAENVTTKKK